MPGGVAGVVLKGALSLQADAVQEAAPRLLGRRRGRIPGSRAGICEHYDSLGATEGISQM